MASPVPAGRGRWRLTVHRRAFAATTNNATILGELAGARGVRLDRAWNTPATLTFSLDGADPQAGLVDELVTDIVAWRWDETAAADIIMFKGPVCMSEDQVNETSAVVTFTCHDYAAMLARRLLCHGAIFGASDSDFIVQILVSLATDQCKNSDSTVSFAPGSYLPLTVRTANPDGTPRTSGAGLPQRDRTYYDGTNVFTAIDELARMVNGFDYAVDPRNDYLNIYWPAQGVNRGDVELVYGSSIATFTRTVNSADYANYWRTTGNNGQSDPGMPQLEAEAWNSDANNVGETPVGVWMSDDSGSADITNASQLGAIVNGDLGRSGQLIPAYTVTVRPGWYRYGYPNMGDTVPLVVDAGRLNENTTVRIMGMAWTLDADTGAEDVELTLGRILPDLHHLFRRSTTAIYALTRR